MRIYPHNYVVLNNPDIGTIILYSKDYDTENIQYRYLAQKILEKACVK